MRNGKPCSAAQRPTIHRIYQQCALIHHILLIYALVEAIGRRDVKFLRARF